MMEKKIISARLVSMDGKMEKVHLINFFSEFWGIDKSEITDPLKMDSQTLEDYSSIRFFQFIAAIESNFNIRVENLDKISNFGDLFNNLK